MSKNIFPKISTRGFYDLQNGRTLNKKPYEIYPPKKFEELSSESEFTVMIHGLRNNKSGALAKYVIAQKRLKALHYNYPVVGYSYDSNTAGVQYKSTAISALKIGIVIAKKNGRNLSKFILDMKAKKPSQKIRLMGHSLGAQVILSTVQSLAKNPKNKNIIESVHIFASSIPANSFNPKKSGNAFQRIVTKKIINYYSPYDDVLRAAHTEKWIDPPIGYEGKVGKTISKYSQKRVKQRNHRFLSYSKNLKSFP